MADQRDVWPAGTGIAVFRGYRQLRNSFKLWNQLCNELLESWCKTILGDVGISAKLISNAAVHMP